jgi:hypothetical protein
MPVYNYQPPVVNNLPSYQPPIPDAYQPSIPDAYHQPQQPSQYPSMMPPPSMHLPPPQEFNPHSHLGGGGPAFEMPSGSINRDDRESIASVDDFEARLAALKRL